MVLTPINLAAGAVLLGLLVQAFIRLRYAYKYRRAGGVSAAKLAKDPVTGGFGRQYICAIAHQCSIGMALDHRKGPGKQSSACAVQHDIRLCDPRVPKSR